MAGLTCTSPSLATPAVLGENYYILHPTYIVLRKKPNYLFRMLYINYMVTVIKCYIIKFRTYSYFYKLPQEIYILLEHFPIFIIASQLHQHHEDLILTQLSEPRLGRWVIL